MAKKKNLTVNKADELIERYGVREIYENSRGEFFLTKDLAVNSESGNGNLVQTHKKE